MSSYGFDIEPNPELLRQRALEEENQGRAKRLTEHHAKKECLKQQWREQLEKALEIANAINPTIWNVLSDYYAAKGKPLLKIQMHDYTLYRELLADPSSSPFSLRGENDDVGYAPTNDTGKYRYFPKFKNPSWEPVVYDTTKEGHWAMREGDWVPPTRVKRQNIPGYYNPSEPVWVPPVVSRSSYPPIIAVDHKGEVDIKYKREPGGGIYNFGADMIHMGGILHTEFRRLGLNLGISVYQPRSDQAGSRNIPPWDRVGNNYSSTSYELIQRFEKK